MDLTLIKDFAQLGGTVVTVVLFLNYLTKRDSKWTDSLKENSQANVVLARALQKLTDTVVRNTLATRESVPTVSENTSAINENTSAVKVSNGHTKGKI